MRRHQEDGAILTVAAADGPMPLDTRNTAALATCTAPSSAHVMKQVSGPSTIVEATGVPATPPPPL